MATKLNGQFGLDAHTAESVPSETTIHSVTKPRKDSAHIFRFFDLPRELRDKIYEQPVLMEHWRIPSLMLNDHDHDRYVRGEKLNTSLLLVNRQFRDEYTERCSDQQTLCLRDYLGFSDTIGVLNVLDELKSWVLSICIIDSSAQITAPRRLQPYLENCARWYHDLPAVNIKLYLNYQSDLKDCGPYVCDHMQSTIADIASFKKIANLEIYMTKPAQRHKRASWSRRLLARWRRDEPEPTILLGLAPYIEDSEWEDFEGFGLGVDCSSPSSSSSSSSSSNDEDNGDDKGDDTDYDQDGHDGYRRNLNFYEELLNLKGYESVDGRENVVGDGIDSDGIDSNEDAGQFTGDELLHSNHANNTPSHLDIFRSPGGIPDSTCGQPGMLQDQNSTLYAFGKIMNGEDTDDHDDDEDDILYLRSYKKHTGSSRTTNVQSASPVDSDPFPDVA